MRQTTVGLCISASLHPRRLEFYAAGGLLRLLSPEEIFDEDRMRDVLTELKKKDAAEEAFHQSR